jgi:flagellin-specific chaperone FliS
MRLGPLSTGVVIAADLVAHAANGADEGPVGAAVELATQIVDVDVDDVRENIAVHPPDIFDNAGARNRLAGMTQQVFKERVLFGTQINGAAGATHFVRNAIDFEVFEGEDVLRGAALTAKNGANARDQFSGHKRFEHHIIGAGIFRVRTRSSTDASAHIRITGKCGQRRNTAPRRSPCGAPETLASSSARVNDAFSARAASWAQSEMTRTERGEIERRVGKINHALLVIAELQGVLDFEKGGAAAKQFGAFYKVSRTEILKVSVSPSREGFQRLIDLFLPVYKAWEQISRQLPSTPARTAIREMRMKMSAPQVGRAPEEETGEPAGLWRG